MFCDLVGSTGISAQLDAEECGDLVGAYLDAASAAVVEMGGHVAKKLGDGLMSLFGYPVAHENDAERAVRAALAIQRALAGLNRNNAGSGIAALGPRSSSPTRCTRRLDYPARSCNGRKSQFALRQVQWRQHEGEQSARNCKSFTVPIFVRF